MAYLISNGLGYFSRVGLHSVVELKMEELPDQLAPIVGSTIASRQEFERIASVGHFGRFQRRDEGAPTTFDSLQARFVLDVRPQAYALAFDISKEAGYTDQTGGKILNHGERLAHALRVTKNHAGAQLFNGGFTAPASNGTITLDNVAWFSNAHPLATGGTSSNVPAVAANLSYATMKNGLQEIPQQLTDRGEPNPIRGQMILVVPPGEEMNAYEIVNTQLQPHSADNTVNAARPRISRIMTLDWLTDSNAWFLIPEGGDNPVTLLTRVPLYTAMNEDASRQVMSFFMGEEWALFVKDWRGTYGSNPS